MSEEKRQDALLQPPSTLAARHARRRATHVFGALHVLTLEVVLGEQQILRAGLAINLEAAPLRARDLLHGLTIRHVHDHHRHVDQLGERDRPVRRFALDHDRPRLRVRGRFRLARTFQAPVRTIDSRFPHAP